MTENDYEDLHQWTKEYIDINCLIKNKVMPGKLPGTTYTWIFYLRNGLFNHQFLTSVSLMFMYKIHKQVGHFDFQLAGLETGSTALLAGIPLIAKGMGHDINAFSVRKERKTYGLLNWIEGIPNNKPVMIVDDLCNSSVSMRKCYDVLQAHDIPVLDQAFSIVSKVNKRVHGRKRIEGDLYLPESIKVNYLFDLDDFNLSNPSH